MTYFNNLIEEGDVIFEEEFNKDYQLVTFKEALDSSQWFSEGGKFDLY